MVNGDSRSDDENAQEHSKYGYDDRWGRRSWYDTGRAKAYSDSANTYYQNILFKMAEAQKQEGFNEEDKKGYLFKKYCIRHIISTNFIQKKLFGSCFLAIINNLNNGC